MSRLRHAKGLPRLAGAGSGIHRLKVDKPLPTKPEEERKCGGKIEGSKHHTKLGRKRGGACKREDGGNVTTVSKTSQSNPPAPPKPSDYMSPDDIKESIKADHIRRMKDHPANGLSNADNFIDQTRSYRAKGGWIKSAINPAHKGIEQRAAKKAGESTHDYMESHKHDSGKSGDRARLGLRLSAMAKHKKD